jgi:hypothetical protein
VWVLWLYFGWPQGLVWANVAAEAVIVPGAMLWAHRRGARHALGRVDELLEKKLAHHHDRMVASITAAVAAPTEQEGGDAACPPSTS